MMLIDTEQICSQCVPRVLLNIFSKLTRSLKCQVSLFMSRQHLSHLKRVAGPGKNPLSTLQQACHDDGHGLSNGPHSSSSFPLHTLHALSKLGGGPAENLSQDGIASSSNLNKHDSITSPVEFQIHFLTEAKKLLEMHQGPGI